MDYDNHSSIENWFMIIILVWKIGLWCCQSSPELAYDNHSSTERWFMIIFHILVYDNHSSIEKWFMIILCLTANVGL